MVSDVIRLVSLLYPFSLLSPEQLRTALGDARIMHLPANDSVPADFPEIGVVCSGRLQLLLEDRIWDTLLPGDMLGLRAIHATLPVAAGRAVDDAVLLILPVASLHGLMAADHAWATAVLGKAQRLEQHLEGLCLVRPVLTDPYLRREAGSMSLPAPLLLPVDMPVATAAQQMLHSGVTACLAGTIDAVSGIVTERDVAALAARGGTALDTARLGDIMTTGLITVTGSTSLFEAFAIMVRRNIRRLIVVNDEDRPVGILQERDLLAARGENPLHLARHIAAADDAATLAGAARDLRDMILRCVDEGIGAEQIGRLVAEMHDQLLIRAATLVLERYEHADFALLVLGSEGRREQFLATDQDNALILGREPTADQDALGLGFATAFSALLAEIGLPPCPHQVMVSNPQWRMSLAQWETRINALTLAPDAQAVLQLAMLADARHIAGDPALCEGLRSHLLRRVTESPVLLKYLAREALRFTPPMGFFGNLVLEKSGPRQGALDVKKGGIFPLTQGLKTLALEHGLAETGTLDRLRRLRQDGVFSETLALDLREAYEVLQTMRLTAQAAAVRRGVPPCNDIWPERMPSPERDRLKNCLRIVLDFQKFLHTKYGLHLIS